MEPSSYQDFLKSPQTVSHVRINYYDTDYDPSKLTELKGLSFYHCTMEEIPDWVKRIKGLEYLKVEGTALKSLPDSLGSLGNLKKITLAECNFCQFPGILLEMKQLEELDLAFCEIEHLPEKVELPNLKKLILVNNPVENGPALDFMMQLPSLVEYELPSTMSLKYSYGKANPDVYYFEKFFASICKQRKILFEKDGIGREGFLILCLLFKKDKQSLQKINQIEIFKLLNASGSKYRDMVLEYLVENSEKVETLKGKKGAIIGKLKLKKDEINDWIAETGAELESKFSPKHDFVILGENPGEAVNNILDSGVKILFERNIWDIKDSAYLMKEEDGSQENLNALLQNSDPQNLEIAFQIMDKGGLPTEILEEIIAIMLFHIDSKIRKRSKILFDRYVTVDFTDHTKKLLDIQAYRMKDDKKLTEYLQNLVKDTLLDLDKLAFAVYRHSGKEQAQGLCLSLPESSKLVIDDYIKNCKLELVPHTRLDNGLYYDKFPAALESVIPKLNTLKFEASKIKNAEEYRRLKGLKGLILENGHSRSFPKYLFENTDFEELEIAAYGITKIDKSIGGLKNLKKLRLYLSAVKELPTEFTLLTGLEDLNLTLAVNEFPQIILELKNLKYLYLGMDLKAFPKELEALADMPFLKYLSLRADSKCPQEDKKRMEIIRKTVEKR